MTFKISFLKSSHVGIYILFIILCFLNSFCCWLLMSLLLSFPSYRGDKNFVRLWSIISIVFISLYNATKIPQNDLVWYVNYYLAANKTFLTDYVGMLSGGKEMLYQVIVWIIHLFGGNNYHVFVFTISLISYAFLLASINLTCRELNLKDDRYLFIVSLLIFFPYTYAISVHLVRQFLAASIAIYLLIYYNFAQKKWLVTFAGFATCFIHSSTIFFIPFFILPLFSKAISRKNIWIYAGLVIGILSMSIIAYQMLPYLSDSATLEHIAEKAAYGTTFDADSVQFKLSYLIFSIGLIIFALWALYEKKNKMLFVSKTANITINSSIILLFFILVNNNSVELQARYARFYWQLFPLFACIYLSRWKLHKMVLAFGCILLFFLWNFYNTNISDWTYTCALDYWYYPLPMFFYD